MQTVKMRLEGLATHIEAVATVQRQILNVLHEGPDRPDSTGMRLRRELEVEVPEEIYSWEVGLSPGFDTPYPSTVCVFGSLGGVVVPLEQIPDLIEQLRQAEVALRESSQ
jgi:hypothetical protein